MVKLRRISMPSWSLGLIVDEDDDGGTEAKQAFQPHLERILDTLQEHMEQFVNDPEFYHPDDLLESEEQPDFPETALLTGEYYIGRQSYSRKQRQGKVFYELSIFFYFTQKPFPGWPHPSDYLSLEAVIRIDSASGNIELMEGFNYAAI